jgi:hypothetical protein
MEGWLVKVLCFKLVAIAQLKFPGHWRKVLDDPSIPARAWSLKLVGQLQEPMVRKKDWKVIYGNRRIAAAIHNGETHVLVKLVECTDEEAELIGRIENAHREHMKPDELRQFVNGIIELAATVEATGGGSIIDPKQTTTRIKLPKVVAQAIAADALGITQEGVKKTLQREKKRKAKLKETIGHDPDLGIRSPWAVLDDKFRRQTNEVVAVTNGAAQLLVKVMQQLSRMETAGLPLHIGRMNAVRENIAVCARALRALLPTWLCPKCKGIPLLQPKCATCMATGYITKNQEDAITAELWRVEDPVVLSDGKYYPVTDFYEGVA